MSGQFLIERQIPLRCTRQSAASPAHTQSNQLAFVMLDALDEPIHTRKDSEPQGEAARLDTKLNLILQLLTQLLHKDAVLPPAHAVRFASDAVTWPDTDIRAGEPVVCELYLDAGVPVPIVLQGPVVLDNGWARLGLASLDEEQQAAWSRWVFRQHRRDVARSRQHP